MEGVGKGPRVRVEERGRERTDLRRSLSIDAHGTRATRGLGVEQLVRRGRPTGLVDWHGSVGMG